MQAARQKKSIKSFRLSKGAIIWLLVSLAVFAALPGMMSGNYLPKIFWVSLTVGIGLALLPPRREGMFSLTLLGGIWLAYLAWALLSLTWAIQPRVGLERWLVMLVLTLAYLLAARTRFWDSSVFWRGFSIIASLAAAIGILFLAGIIGLTIRGDREFRRVRAEAEKVLAYRETLEKSGDLPEATLDHLRRELGYALPRLRVRLNRLADRVLPTMHFDSNMRHITCHQFAGLAWSLNDYRLTEKFARRALEFHPHDRTALTYLAAVALREGRSEAARQLLHRGVEIFGYNPYMPFFGENLAHLYRSRGDHLRAREIMEKMEAHRVIAPVAPAPPNRAKPVPIGSSLAWEACPGAVSYDLYLWPEREQKLFPPPVATGLKESRFRPRGGLRPETTYFWRVRAVGKFGEDQSPIWFFRTGPNRE